MSPIDDSSSYAWRSSCSAALPVAPDHLDEVAEPFCPAHRRAREVAELLPIRDAFQDHLARGVPLAEHPAELAQEAQRIGLGGAMAPNALEDLLRPARVPRRRASARRRARPGLRSGRPAGSAGPARDGRTRRRGARARACPRAGRGRNAPSSRGARHEPRRSRRRSPRRALPCAALRPRAAA